MALVLAAAVLAAICACLRVVRLVWLPLVAMSILLPELVARLIFVRVLQKLEKQEWCACPVARYLLLVAQGLRPEVVLALRAGLARLQEEACACRVAPAALPAVVPSPSALLMAVHRVAVVLCLCSRARLRLVLVAR